MAHSVVELWRSHQPATYPPGVIGVPRRIAGRAFFPGGAGLWAATDTHLPAFPVGGLMILGHDFHSEAGYVASLARGHESHNQPTWRNLCALLDSARIPMSRCFFTNYYMGLRQGDVTVGPFPGAGDAEFEKHCGEFFCQQIRVMKPRAILTLGRYVPKLIAQHSDDLTSWRTASTFGDIDTVGPVMRATFDSVGYHVIVGALIHPSLRHASVKHRRFKEQTGEAAELAIVGEIRAALQSDDLME